MRITAKEAKEKADVITSKDACMNGVMRKIKEACEAGYYETRIYNDMPKEPSLSKLFNKEHIEYITSALKEMGYKVSTTEVCLKVRWDE